MDKGKWFTSYTSNSATHIPYDSILVFQISSERKEILLFLKDNSSTLTLGFCDCETLKQCYDKLIRNLDVPESHRLEIVEELEGVEG